MVRLKLDLPYIASDVRPIFSYVCENNYKIDILFDSGADTSVWTFGANMLLLVFPNARRLNMKAPISGFGSGVVLADVYNIGDFVISDIEGKKITIENFCVAVVENSKFRFHMILSMNVFAKSSINLEYRGKEKYLIIQGSNIIRYNPAKANNNYIHMKDNISTQPQKRYRYTCTERIYEGKDIVGYVIFDREIGEAARLAAHKVKKLLRTNQMQVDNLKITKDSRIYYKG